MKPHTIGWVSNLTSILSQENTTQTYPQTNVIETIPEVKSPLPTNSSLAQIDQHSSDMTVCRHIHPPDSLFLLFTEAALNHNNRFQAHSSTITTLSLSRGLRAGKLTPSFLPTLEPLTARGLDSHDDECWPKG